MSVQNLWRGVNTPFNTVEGGKWLSKALDPASIRTDVGGLPDTNSSNVCVLNYQTQDAITPYDVTLTTGGGDSNAEYTSYDADLFLYQHPIYLGCSASYLSDTADPSIGRFTIYGGETVITYTDANGAMTKSIVKDSYTKYGIFFSQSNPFAPSTFGPRTISLIKNEQIPGRTYTDQQQQMIDFCQRYRFIYGGAQIIPSCSDNYNSGTVEACQQVFNAGESVANNIKINQSNEASLKNFTPAASNDDTRSFVTSQVRVLNFNDNDFPTSSDIVQNPQGMLARYREGVFIPYKMINPLNHPYLTAEEQKVINSPFWITGAKAKLYTNKNEQGQPRFDINHTITKFPSGNAGDWTPLVWNRLRNGFVLANDPNPNPNPPANDDFAFFMGWLALECVSYLGVGFNILFYLPSVYDVPKELTLSGELRKKNGTVVKPDSDLVYKAAGADGTFSIKISYSSNDPLSFDGSIRRCAYNTPPVAYPLDFSKGITIHNSVDGDYDLSRITTFGVPINGVLVPKPGFYSLCVANRITTNQDNNANKTPEGNYNNGEITFPQHSRIAVVNFRSISTTAGMKMLIRLGNEITLSSGTIYSMFKHRSPTYDEQAIKSYLRCIHEMKDAFYGDAASDEGHDKYAEMIRTLVWQTPTEDFTTTQGTAFSGQISV